MRNPRLQQTTLPSLVSNQAKPNQAGGRAGKWETGSDDDEGGGGGVLGVMSPDAVSRFCKAAARSFFEERGLVSHQINSYDSFVDVGLQRLFDTFGEIEVLDQGGGRLAARDGQVLEGHGGAAVHLVGESGRGHERCYGREGWKRPGKGPKGEDPGGGDSLAGGYLKLLPKHARLMKMSYPGRIKVKTSWENYTKWICHSDKFKTGVEKFEKKNVLASGKKEFSSADCRSWRCPSCVG